MKYMIFILVFVQTVLGERPNAKLSLRVLDDSGNAITNGSVQVTTFDRWEPGGIAGKDMMARAVGNTDTNGLVAIQFSCLDGSAKYGVVSDNNKNDPLYIEVDGKKYYRDMGGAISFTNNSAGRWEPWNPEVNVMLKAVENPVSMYARFLRSRSGKLPKINKAIGFDLIKSDWVAPYGSGNYSDFIFKLNCELGQLTKDKIQYHKSVLHLTFANEGDGIIEYSSEPRKGSILRLPQKAPISG